MIPSGRNFVKLVAATVVCFTGYNGYQRLQWHLEERRMSQTSVEELLQLGQKVIRDFETLGYTQLPISQIRKLHLKDLNLSFRLLVEFGVEQLDLVEKVWDRYANFTHVHV
jgi:hypothetical protein